MNDGPQLGRPVRLEDGIWWHGYQHARDIPDDLFLAAMKVASRERERLLANSWDVASVLGTGHISENISDEIDGVPYKVVLAKAKRLIARNVITGCPCGCRGDFKISGNSSGERNQKGI